ncbi:MAG: carbamoyltransferase HypF [Bacillota bacterium]|nr:carbamoyltransferase HypF [Bacillota bacterium]
MAGGEGGPDRQRWRVTVRGTVQGVGFRPFVWRAATARGLRGWVANAGAGVVIEAEGPTGVLEEFVGDLRSHPPLLARVDEVDVQVLADPAPVPEEGFRIVASQGSRVAQVMIPPDLATCGDCRREISDPGDRHYRYPFTNCTLCGPRFTVVTGLPYDRSRTTLASFAMCEDCRREYEDPGDRRFHAQPTACPRCGPRARVVDAAGREVPGSWDEVAQRLLREGCIVAVKGMGGYHLACDATSTEAVARLRERKRRPARPFAVMFPDLETVRAHCLVSGAEEALLTSARAPIVILIRRGEDEEQPTLAPAVAPGLDTVGAMLPYTPLHFILLEGAPPLVMTSGNRTGLPIARDEDEAFSQLGDLADYFLVHDRPIFRRCDDSLVRVMPVLEPSPHAGTAPAAAPVVPAPARSAGPAAPQDASRIPGDGGRGSVQLLRRSRGYVPEAITLPLPPGASAAGLPVVAALGAEMKNVVCLTRGDRAYLSQHLGEMDTVEGIDNLREALAQMASLLGVEPVVLARDMHPSFSLTGLAAQFLPERQVAVQHHHAHLASVLAEAGVTDSVVGLVADGVGYGTDGHVWGLEVLVGSLAGFYRAAHLAYVPLPGGEGAIRNPLRMAVSYLGHALGEEGLGLARLLFPGREREVVATWHLCARPGLMCSSAGRLFDAVSALLGICHRNTYEGQAAIELEEEAWRALPGRSLAGLPDRMGEGEQLWGWERAGDVWVVDPGPLVTALAREAAAGGHDAATRRRLALRFHLAVAAMMVKVAGLVAREQGLGTVALSGGTFQNALLLSLVVAGLEQRGLRRLVPGQVPANDGGIALGQAAVAVWKLAGGEGVVPGGAGAGADAGR